MARKAHGSHVTPKAAEWQTHLRSAIEAAYGSINGYAKYLAGEGATTEQVDAKRRLIQKWLEVGGKKPAPVPSVRSITRLRRDGVDVDPAVFPRDTPSPVDDAFATSLLGRIVQELETNPPAGPAPHLLAFAASLRAVADRLEAVAVGQGAEELPG